ncbi:MAG: hypothetical protein IPJ87_10145 [Flavobacteriales bacterium]|nr:hypothetical protein [Flavobacteriales bacterium]MBK7942214.1 hypothetical protein [Flavobacteriales bacterium]MBK9701870.1 hypothetical protein [Flavobacteriales bacterium]
MPLQQTCVDQVRGQVLAHGADAVLWEHSGILTRVDLESALARVEAGSLSVSDPVAVRKRLVSVLVEGVENILHHAGQAQAAEGSVLVGRTEEAYRIVLVNRVELATAALLQHRIEMLNAMDEVALKEHYLMLLANESRTAKGGAGLGLLTMARRSRRPMRVHVSANGGGYAVFCLELAVARGD